MGRPTQNPATSPRRNGYRHPVGLRSIDLQAESSPFPHDLDLAPPVPPTDSTWTGAVLDMSESSGPTARIYRCDSGSATEIDSTTTDSSGESSLTVSGGHHYFVQLDMPGPLANRTVTSGYHNPTSPRGLGHPADVDMGFE